MEKIVSAVPYYYGASKEQSYNIRLIINMKDEINGDMFKNAVKKSMERYPYFCVKVVTKDEELFLEENKKDVVVAHTNEPVALGGDAANEHLLAFSWWENRFFLDVFHGMADGAGLMPLVRTVIYYYCMERYDSALSSQGIRLSGEKIPDEEIIDPYPESVDESIKPVGKYKRKHAFNLRTGGLCTPGNPTWYEILIPEDSFMKYNQANEASPAVVAAVLMSRAIAGLHNDAKEPIICSMAMNVRKALNAMQAHHSLVTQLFLEYKDAMKHMRIRDQITCFRGMIILQGQDENVWQSVRGNLKINERLGTVPTLQGKRQMIQQIVESCLGYDTFKVSYTGKANIGASEKYVKGIDALLDITDNSILIEMYAVSGKFQLTFIQDWPEDIYLKAFLEQLEKENIEYTVSEARPVKVAPIEFCGTH